MEAKMKLTDFFGEEGITKNESHKTAFMGFAKSFLENWLSADWINIKKCYSNGRSFLLQTYNRV